MKVQEITRKPQVAIMNAVHYLPVLVARDDDGSYLGFLPLRVKTVWSRSRQQLRNELQFAGRLFWADYGSVLCRPEHEDADVRRDGHTGRRHGRAASARLSAL